MEMQPVESSNIKAIGYDQATQTLRMEFRNGSIHDYPDTSPADHTNLMAAASHGKHFHQHIRSRKSVKVA
jgi:hypothetical protein